MKKLICLALAALLLCAFSAAAEDLRISLYQCVFDQPQDDCVRVHLLLVKRGGVCYEMEDVLIGMYDGAGQPVTPASKELVVFPMRVTPEGDHYLPVTLMCTLSAPTTIADVTVTGISGRQTGECDVIPLDAGVPWIGGDGVITTGIPLEEGASAEDYFASVIALDADGGYLGNGELKAGDARRVSGAEIIGAVCDVSGWSAAQLAENGFVFDAEEYAFFDRIALPHLTGTPAEFVVSFYRMQTEWIASTPISRRLDRIDMQEDGSFVIHGCFECTWEGTWLLDEMVSLTLMGEDGSEEQIADFTFDSPFCVMEKGLFMPYEISGRASPGFRAADFRFALSVGFAPAVDFHTVSGGCIEPSVSADGTVSVTACMPADAAQAEDCFVCIMFLDLTNDVYQGAVWSCPGEAWLQEGVIRLPRLTAPEGCTIDAAMATMYCVAD